MKLDESRSVPGSTGHSGGAHGPPDPAGGVSAGGLSLVPALFSSPSRAFGRLAADPRWIGNGVLVLVLFALAMWVQLPQQLDLTEEITIASLEKFNAPEEAIDEALARLPDPDDIGPGEVLRQLRNAFIPVLFVVLIGGSVFHLLARIGGVAARWKMSVSIVTLAYVVSALGALVKAGVVRASDTMQVTMGPGAFVPGLDFHSIPAITLDLFDVFSLWGLYLMATGARVAFRTTPGGAWGIAGTYWILKSLVVFGFRTFTAWMMGTL